MIHVKEDNHTLIIKIDEDDRYQFAQSLRAAEKKMVDKTKNISTMINNHSDDIVYICQIKDEFSSLIEQRLMIKKILDKSGD